MCAGKCEQRQQINDRVHRSLPSTRTVRAEQQVTWLVTGRLPVVELHVNDGDATVVGWCRCRSCVVRLLCTSDRLVVAVV